MTRAWLAALSLLACDCSGEAFTVGDAVARFDGGELAAVDDAAPGGEDAAPAPRGDGGKREAAAAARDAGDPPHPVMTIDAGGDPVLEHDASAPPPALDAGTPPPPPALCCMTPCSGSSVAPITCGNGPAWTCAAGSCSEGACGVGATCQWMGTVCTGHVAVCP